MAEHDGGPAFPMAHDLHLGRSDCRGMSLRDYFASAVGAGLCADPEFQESAAEIARIAYEIADAMLAERDKRV